MNIDDVSKIEIPKGDLIEAIFEHQHTLALKYVEIERKNGFYKPDIDDPPHIDNPQYQRWVKDMFWRVTEEIAEALETCPEFAGWKESWGRDVNVRHFFEELSDALHFLVEVSLVVYTSKRKEHIKDISEIFAQEVEEAPMIPLNETVVSQGASKFVFQLGLAANCLKNKPWKTTGMSTDERKFFKELRMAWVYFAGMWASFGCSLEDIYTLYIKKNQVNQFRQRTKY